MVCSHGEKRINNRKSKEIPKTNFNQLCQSHTSDLMRNNHIDRKRKARGLNNLKSASSFPCTRVVSNRTNAASLHTEMSMLLDFLPPKPFTFPLSSDALNDLCRRNG